MTMDITERNKNLLESVDARTRLAGSNKMEILLFSLGTRETFGINVFKVREVGRTPHITKTPNMPRGVEGLVDAQGAAKQSEHDGFCTINVLAAGVESLFQQAMFIFFKGFKAIPVFVEVGCFFITPVHFKFCLIFLPHNPCVCTARVPFPNLLYHTCIRPRIRHI